MLTTMSCSSSAKMCTYSVYAVCAIYDRVLLTHKLPETAKFKNKCWWHYKLHLLAGGVVTCHDASISYIAYLHVASSAAPYSRTNL